MGSKELGLRSKISVGKESGGLESEKKKFFLSFTHSVITHLNNRDLFPGPKQTDDPLSEVIHNNAAVILNQASHKSDWSVSNMLGKDLENKNTPSSIKTSSIKIARDFLINGVIDTLEEIISSPEDKLYSKQKNVLNAFRNGSLKGSLENFKDILEKHFLITDGKIPQEIMPETNDSDKPKIKDGLTKRSYADAYDSLSLAIRIYNEEKTKGRLEQTKKGIFIVETPGKKPVSIEKVVYREIMLRRNEIPLEKIKTYITKYKLSGDKVVIKDKK